MKSYLVNTANYAAQKGLTLIDVDATFDPKKYTKIQNGVYVYKHNSTDFSDIIGLIKKANPDLFFNTGHLRESDPVLMEVINQEFSPKGIGISVGPTYFDWRNNFLARDIVIKGIFGSAQWNEYTKIVGFDDIETPQNFARLFFERYDKPASYFSAGGYACGIVLKDALEKAKSLDNNKINNLLKKTDLETFFSKIKFDSRGLNDKKPIISVQLQLDQNGNLLEIPIAPKEVASGVSIYPFKGWRKIITSK
jgi:branched-chain amino acid transport system substrate-binding protein